MPVVSRLLRGVCLLVGLAAAHGQLRALSSGYASEIASAALVVLMGVGALAVLTRWVFRTTSARRLRLAGWSIIAFFTIARLLWTLVFDSHQVSDFGVYLRCGDAVVTEPAFSILTWMEKCRSSYYPDLSTHWRRSLLYTAPLRLLVHLTTTAIEMTNIALLTAASCLFFSAAERMVGLRRAVVAMPVFMTHPELWYAVTLASHDIPATFWIAALVYLESRRPTSVAPSVARSLAVGFAVYALDVQRDLGLAALMGLAAAMWHGVRRACRQKNSTRVVAVALAFDLLLPVTVFGIARTTEAALVRGSLLSDHLTPLVRVSATDVLSANTWDALYPWHQHYRALPASDRHSFLLKKIAHEYLTDPLLTLSHWRQKIALFAVPAGSLRYATGELDPGILAAAETFATRVARVNAHALGFQYALVTLWGLSTTATAAVHFAWRQRLPSTAAARFLETLSAFVLGFLVFVGETQARYTFFLAFWLALAGAIALSQSVGRRSTGVTPKEWRISALPAASAATAAFTLALLSLALCVGSAIGRASRMTLTDMRATTCKYVLEATPAPSRCNDPNVAVVDLHGFTVRWPSRDAGRYEFTNEVDCRRCRRIRFFAGDARFPAPGEPAPARPGPRLRVFADDIMLSDEELHEAAVHAFGIVYAARQHMRLRFELAPPADRPGGMFFVRYIDVD